MTDDIQGVSGIPAPPEMAVWKYFHAQHSSKRTTFILHTYGENSWSLFQAPKFCTFAIRIYCYRNLDLAKTIGGNDSKNRLERFRDSKK